MSQEKVEIVMGAIVAWNSDDLETARHAWHPDGTMRPPRGWLEPGPVRRRDAIFRQFEQLRETWDADDLKVTDILDHGDRVLTRLTWTSNRRRQRLRPLRPKPTG